VRNLKTKDYLGKARLVATSDRANAFTGFAGSEQKTVSRSNSPAQHVDLADSAFQAARIEIRDDRPVDSISFAASNLVRPGLSSRRQQSEPPINRTVFPPTPPPETERPARGNSVRSNNSTPQKPTLARLNIQTQESNRKYEKANSPPDARPRPGRSASAAPARGFSRDPVPAPLQRRPTGSIQEEEEPSAGDLYDMYQGGMGAMGAMGAMGGSYMSQGSRGSGGSRRQNVRQVSRYTEEPADGSDYDDELFDEADFEMVSAQRRGPGSIRSGGSSRGTSRRPDVRKIRVKVHAEDIRYIMISPTIYFTDFEERVREKFSLRSKFKIKVKDEDMPDGDMITVGDQDDLDMVVASAKNLARKERQEVGKMDVSQTFNLQMYLVSSLTDMLLLHRFG
jgi:hypothetical protein